MSQIIAEPGYEEAANPFLAQPIAGCTHEEGNSALQKNTSVLPFTPSPVWERPQNNYGSNRWVVYSPKLDRQVILYSDLEHDRWVLVESDPLITTFCEQPFRISVKLASGPVVTIFDFWLRWKCGCEELEEVKYKDQLESSARVIRQLAAQRKWTDLHSFRYTISTEEVIRANPIRLTNWKRMLSQLGATNRVSLDPHTDAVTGLLLKAGRLPLSEIELRLRPLDSMLVRSAVFKLIHAGKADAQFLDSKPLDGSTIVEVTQNGNQ
jgi:hypothetical protein